MYKKLNFAAGVLASDIADNATEITLKAGHTIITDIGETNKFVGVFFDKAKSSPFHDATREIVEAYRTDTNVFTIARAKEGTDAKAWVEDDNFMLVATSAVFNEYETAVNAKENVANKKISLTDSDVDYPTCKAVKTAVDAKQDALGFIPENVTNKLTSFQTTPDDTHYPSEKLVKNSLDTKAPLTSPIFATSITGSYLTASEILITDANKKIISAPVATYPSLTELSYVKGVTSGIQSQLGNKAPSASPTFTGTVILPKTLEIQDTSADHQYVLAVSELTADRTITLPLLTADDTFLFKDFHKATSAEINTGTEDNKYITPDQLAGSNAFTTPVQQYCVEYATELAVADGVGYIEIPAKCNGMNLISARATVGTAGTTNASTFDIYNVTDSTSMLSSAISIASGEKSGTGTVDTDHDDVATGDIIRIDVDTLSTTKPKGLIVTLEFRLP